MRDPTVTQHHAVTVILRAVTEATTVRVSHLRRLWRVQNGIGLNSAR